MDDKTGNFDPRGGAMPKEVGKPPTSHGNVLPAGKHTRLSPKS